jgi:hypothetical protein
MLRFRPTSTPRTLFYGSTPPRSVPRNSSGRPVVQARGEYALFHFLQLSGGLPNMNLTYE